MDRTMTYFRTHPSTPPVPLDPELRAAIEAEPDGLYLLPLDEFRTAAAQRSATTPKLNAAVQAVENRGVAGPDGEIPIRIYRPQAVARSRAGLFSRRRLGGRHVGHA